MKKFYVIGLSILLLTGCTTESVQEEIEREVAEAIEKKTDELIDGIVTSATEEGKKKSEELIKSGEDLVNGWLGTELSLDQFTQVTSDETIPVEYITNYDADTYTVMTQDGQELKIRALLIDGSEMNHREYGKQPFAEEGRDRAAEILKSGEITISYDIGEQTDKYGRSLNYVFVDGVLLQEVLVREGLARVGYVYPPNTRHLDKLEAAQKLAKEEGIGIWSIENYVNEEGNGFVN